MQGHTFLDNIVWHTLNGTHAKFSIGTDRARRYAHGFSPIAGFTNAESPDLDVLVPYVDEGEHLYCDGWSGRVPTGWQIDFESTMFKMVWDADAPAERGGTEVVRLGAPHAPPAVELAVLTNPGPFGPRTIELGEYVGVFDGPRLVAMAGERFCAGAFREISGVCTHPDFQGRGFAHQLMARLIGHQLSRGEIPFLHVVRDNVSAHQLYTRMGFRDCRESVVRVISRR